jgi:hypothetical protein
MGNARATALLPGVCLSALALSLGACSGGGGQTEVEGPPRVPVEQVDESLWAGRVSCDAYKLVLDLQNERDFEVAVVVTAKGLGGYQGRQAVTMTFDTSAVPGFSCITLDRQADAEFTCEGISVRLA